MSRSKKNQTGKSEVRDPGGFIALPWSVVDSEAYSRLSMHARALLLEIARQYVRDNNGRLLCSRAYMATRGWHSVSMLSKAKAELLEGGFIFETVKGQRPNKASWYALTWFVLDRHYNYDEGAAALFERGAYRKCQPQKIKPLVPPRGTGAPKTVPPHGTETPSPVPPHGTMRPLLEDLSVPPDGHHLEGPSAGARQVPINPVSAWLAAINGSGIN